MGRIAGQIVTAAIDDPDVALGTFDAELAVFDPVSCSWGVEDYDGWGQPNNVHHGGFTRLGGGSEPFFSGVNAKDLVVDAFGWFE